MKKKYTKSTTKTRKNKQENEEIFALFISSPYIKRIKLKKIWLLLHLQLNDKKR